MPVDRPLLVDADGKLYVDADGKLADADCCCQTCPRNVTAINSITIVTRVNGFSVAPTDQNCQQSFDFTWTHVWTRVDRDFDTPVDPVGDTFQTYNDCTKDILVPPFDLGDLAAAISTEDVNATMTCARGGGDAPAPDNYFNTDVFFNGDTGMIEAGANGSLLCYDSIGLLDACGWVPGVTFDPFPYDLNAPHTYNLDTTIANDDDTRELRVRMTITLAA